MSLDCDISLAKRQIDEKTRVSNCLQMKFDIANVKLEKMKAEEAQVRKEIEQMQKVDKNVRKLSKKLLKLKATAWKDSGR